MLHFLSLIWVSLLLAAGAGGLIVYGFVGRRFSSETRESDDLAVESLALAHRRIEAQDQQIQNLAAELLIRTQERDQARKTLPSKEGPSSSPGAGGDLPMAEAGREDDLQKISGISPVVASWFHSVGIRTFKQIAQLPPDLIDKIAEQITLVQGNLDPTVWPQQGKALHREKYGEEL